MAVLGFLVFLTGGLPLAHAIRRYAHTSLGHAVCWAVAAWLVWTVVLAGSLFFPDEALSAGRYARLCMVACAGVAVLGARRPGVAAWNFVVLGLLAVLLLSWLEGFLTGSTVELGTLRAIFLGGTLGLIVVNYLPTRLGMAALLLGLGCGLELAGLISGSLAINPAVSGLLLGLVPWAAWVGVRLGAPSQTDFQRLWREFRDAYGLVWAQRVREQFNRAAANAGWPVELGWTDLRPGEGVPTLDSSLDGSSLATLQALLKRFGLLDSTADAQ